MSKTKYMKLQPVYTLGDLAKALSISRRRADRLLKNAGIPSRLMGGLRMILVSDIELRMPGLWASMVACERARAITRALEGVGPTKR